MGNPFMGWRGVILALAAELTTVSIEVSGLSSWDDIMTPLFVGKFLAHIPALLIAYIAGYLVPTGGR